MKNLLRKVSLFFLLILYSLPNFIYSSNRQQSAGDSCTITGPVSVVTNTIVVYTTTVLNQNWEVYSYDGASAQIERFDDDSLEVNTGPTAGRFTVYVLANPSKEQLCSLNVTIDAALPVELSSFASIVNGRDVKLFWVTLSEQNNSGFEIQRSKANSEWSVLSFVRGNGNTITGYNYSYEDKNLSTGRYKYRLKQIDYNGNFIYFNLKNEVFVGTPEKFSLSQNYPNPFNPGTKIDFDTPSDGIVKIKVYDINGREVAELLNEFRAAGYYTITFDGASLNSGLYFYKLESENFMSVKKMMLVK